MTYAVEFTTPNGETHHIECRSRQHAEHLCDRLTVVDGSEPEIVTESHEGPPEGGCLQVVLTAFVLAVGVAIFAAPL